MLYINSLTPCANICHPKYYPLCLLSVVRSILSNGKHLSEMQHQHLGQISMRISRILQCDTHAGFPRPILFLRSVGFHKEVMFSLESHPKDIPNNPMCIKPGERTLLEDMGTKDTSGFRC